jgi:hypothetical protein
MKLFQTWDKKRTGRLLGLVVALAGCVIVAVGFNNTTWETSGLVVCMIGAFTARACRVKSSDKLRVDHQRGLYAGKAQRSGRLAWVVGIASTAALVGSFVALYADAAFGSHWEWPLYAIGVSALICALSWGYLAAKMGWFV